MSHPAFFKAWWIRTCPGVLFGEIGGGHHRVGEGFDVRVVAHRRVEVGIVEVGDAFVALAQEFVEQPPGHARLVTTGEDFQQLEHPGFEIVDVVPHGLPLRCTGTAARSDVLSIARRTQQRNMRGVRERILRCEVVVFRDRQGEGLRKRKGLRHGGSSRRGFLQESPGRVQHCCMPAGRGPGPGSWKPRPRRHGLAPLQHGCSRAGVRAGRPHTPSTHTMRMTAAPRRAAFACWYSADS